MNTLQKLLITTGAVLIAFPLISAPDSTINHNPKVEGISGKEISNKQEVRLKVAHFDVLEKKAEQSGKMIIPFFNDIAFEGIRVSRQDGDTVKFYLVRDEASSQSWHDLLVQRKGFTATKVAVSIGLEDGDAIESNVNDIRFVFVHTYAIYLCVLLLAGLITAFMYLAVETNLIRDSGPKPQEPGKLKPYSIGKTQMAFWFFLVLSSYLILWILTGKTSEITSSVLILMGISSATALGATAIDTNKLNVLKGKVDRTKQEVKPIDERINETKKILDDQSVAKSVSEKEELLSNLQKLKTKKEEMIETQNTQPTFLAGRISKSFFEDVLSDNTGFSFHRFQILAWTLVLGIIFIKGVLSDLQMPEFDDTTLALMGISSGTYIGFKFPEQQAD